MLQLRRADKQHTPATLVKTYSNHHTHIRKQKAPSPPAHAPVMIHTYSSSTRIPRAACSRRCCNQQRTTTSAPRSVSKCKSISAGHPSHCKNDATPSAAARRSSAAAVAHCPAPARASMVVEYVIHCCGAGVVVCGGGWAVLGARGVGGSAAGPPMLLVTWWKSRRARCHSPAVARTARSAL